MRNINLRYCEETYDEQGVLTDFKVKCPDTFNFGYDVVDDIAENDPDRRAMMWCNPEGEEHLFTFADMKRWSDKTANYLAAHGVGKGDMVMVILRRHYQFWFVATALAKLGAVMVPATFMLKEHDLEYRLNGASIKAVICTSIGTIAQVVDNVVDRCPSVEHLFLVNGAGGGLTEQDADGNWLAVDGPVGAVLSGPEGVCAVPGKREGWHDFNTGVRDACEEFSRVETHVGDPMLMYFSSGTSGNPKMVLHDSYYALAHLVTAKHWHNVKPDGLHLTIADTGWGKAVWGKYYGQWLMEACVLTYDFDRFHADEILDLDPPLRGHHAVLPAHHVPHDDAGRRGCSRSEHAYVLHHRRRGAQPRSVRLLERAHGADHLRGLRPDGDAADGSQPHACGAQARFDGTSFAGVHH